MSRPRSLKPSYCHHKSTDRAYVTIAGRRRYLGPYGSQASRDAYDTAIAEWISQGRPVASMGITGPAEVLVKHVVLSFWQHAEKTYVDDKGALTVEADNFRRVLRIVRRLYGDAPGKDFGPLALKAVREEMVRLNWCRTNINRQVGHMKQVFKWAVENEMLPGSVHHALQAVAGFRLGKGGARESEPVRPVPEADVLAVLPFLSPHVRAMTELQMHTGTRSGELCILRTCDIDRSGPTWGYQPQKHKTLHKGKVRLIHFGPKARDILRPLLKTDLQALIFSPRESEQLRLAELHKRRKTHVQPSQVEHANEQRSVPSPASPNDEQASATPPPSIAARSSGLVSRPSGCLRNSRSTRPTRRTKKRRGQSSVSRGIMSIVFTRTASATWWQPRSAVGGIWRPPRGARPRQPEDDRDLRGARREDRQERDGKSRMSLSGIEMKR